MIEYSILQYNLGGYEPFREPAFDIPSNVEYVYVTDIKNASSNKMNVVHVECEPKRMLEKCSHIKYHLFDYCSTNVCFYLDACKQITHNIDSIIERFVDSKCDIALNVHSNNFSILEELKAWIKYRGIPKDDIDREISFMENRNYDFKYRGLYQGTSRIEKRNSVCRDIAEMTHWYKLAVSTDSRFERVDQAMFSFIVNRYFSNALNAMPYSSRIYYSKYIVNYEHSCNIRHNGTRDMSDPYLDNGYLFNNEVKLEQFI